MFKEGTVFMRYSRGIRLALGAASCLFRFGTCLKLLDCVCIVWIVWFVWIVWDVLRVSVRKFTQGLGSKLQAGRLVATPVSQRAVRPALPGRLRSGQP